MLKTFIFVMILLLSSPAHSACGAVSHNVGLLSNMIYSGSTFDEISTRIDSMDDEFWYLGEYLFQIYETVKLYRDYLTIHEANYKVSKFAYEHCNFTYFREKYE